MNQLPRKLLVLIEDYIRVERSLLKMSPIGCECCKHKKVCKFIDLKNKLLEYIKKYNKEESQDDIFNIICKYFESNLPIMDIETTKLNESSPMKFYGTESNLLKNVIY